MKIFLFISSFIFLISCNYKNNVTPQRVGVNYGWLDSIMKFADTTYAKKYGTAKFTKAEYYINRKDSTNCQVMKDALDTVRQIIITKNNRRAFFASYYSNGQLTALLPLDTFGQYHGPSKYYYQNGNIESEGEYKNGLKIGTWKNYRETGEPLTVTEYNNNGQAIQTKFPK